MTKGKRVKRVVKAEQSTSFPNAMATLEHMAQHNPPPDFEKDPQPRQLRKARKAKAKAILLYQNKDGQPKLSENGGPAKPVRTAQIIKRHMPPITPRMRPLK